MVLPPVAWVNWEALTVMSGLVLGDLLASVTLVTVTVKVPAVLKVTLKALVPDTKAASGGSVADASLERIRTVSVTVLTKFQLASTALTVTAKRMPAI